MEKRKYKDIQIIEVFHESKRQKICEYKSIIKENCFEGTQVFEYDEAGNLLKRTVIQNHSGSGQLRECCFAYDGEINVNYIYSFVIREGKAPVIVFHTDDFDKAQKVLEKADVKLVEEEDL